MRTLQKYTEGAKKYGVNTWQNLENGYERYKGALLRHLYASTYEEFDPETKVRHEAAVAWNSVHYYTMQAWKKLDIDTTESTN